MNRVEFLEKLKNSRYFAFIEECRNKKDEGGEKEIHHIYLRKFEDGKIDDSQNLIALSRTDHIIAHILLALSLEDLGRTEGRTYKVAEAAVNGMLSFRWSKLQKEEKEALLQTIPATIRCWNNARKTTLEQRSITNRNRYGGNTTMLNTEEAKNKSLSSRKSRYGSYTAQCMTPEAREKVRLKQIQKYGEAGGQLHTAEAKAKSRRTRVERYGTEMGCMNTPEIIEKRVKAQRESAKLRYTVMHSEEFLLWYDKTRFKTKQGAVKTFLKEKNRSLKDYCK